MTATLSTTKLANEAWEALFRAQSTIAQELTARDAWEDLVPREYGVLYALSSADPQGLRITELGADVLLTQPGMSRLVARLEARGLVQRVNDLDDARACLIRLTPAGAATQRRIGRVHARHVAEAMTRTPRSRGARTAPRSEWEADLMRRLVIVSAGTSQPSTTRMLADRIAAGSLEVLREMEITATIGAVEVAPLAVDVARASVTGVPSAELQAAIEQIAAADAVIASARCTRPGSAGCSRRSLTCSTTTC